MVLKQIRLSGLDHVVFENDVKMYGTQTARCHPPAGSKFENDVKMYGTQTYHHPIPLQICLRMM